MAGWTMTGTQPGSSGRAARRGPAQGDPDLGRRIRKYRERRGLSRPELAQQVGRSKGWLLKVENGRTDPLRSDLVLLADRLGIEVERFFRDDESSGASRANGSTSASMRQRRLTPASDPGMIEAEVWPAGSDPGEWLEEMRRRAFLRAMATMTGASAIGWWPGQEQPGQHQPHLQLTELRRAVLGRDASTAALEPPDLGFLRQSVHELWDALQGARYSAALEMMPALLRQGQHAVSLLDGDERCTAALLLAETYQAVSTLMRKVGDRSLATIAADRAMAAASLNGTAVAVAESARFLSLVLSDAGLHQQAIQVCSDAAARFESEERRPSLADLSIYGQLILTGAEAAAQKGDAALCRDFFQSAVGVGRRLGTDANHSFTAFGPTNIGVHRVHASVVLGQGELAVRQAQRIDLTRLPVLERRARHLLDVALAYNLVARSEDATVTLLTAENMASEEVRYDPLARVLVEQLRQRSRSLSAQLDALAGRMPPLPA